MALQLFHQDSDKIFIFMDLVQIKNLGHLPGTKAGPRTCRGCQGFMGFTVATV